MNWLKRIFGYTECSYCKKEFKRTKNTSCGFVDGKDVYYCNDCSVKILNDALAGKNPFEDISLCDGCFCATHTLEGGKCGKCGFIKEEK